jgi:ribonucleoside-diphosphate reductase alpha chain
MVSGNGSNGIALVELAAKDLVEKAYMSPSASSAPVIKDAPRTVTRPKTESEHSEKIRVAKLQGYEGDPCGNCGAFTLVRNGVCLKCQSCGETSGCS